MEKQKSSTIWIYILEAVFITLSSCLQEAGKVQKDTVVGYLGLGLTPTNAAPLEFAIAMTGLKILNDFRKLCGNLNWIRPYYNERKKHRKKGCDKDYKDSITDAENRVKKGEP